MDFGCWGWKRGSRATRPTSQGQRKALLLPQEPVPITVFLTDPTHQLIDWCLQNWLSLWPSPIKLHKSIQVLLPAHSSSNISPSTMSCFFFKISQLGGWRPWWKLSLQQFMLDKLYFTLSASTAAVLPDPLCPAPGGTAIYLAEVALPSWRADHSSFVSL